MQSKNKALQDVKSRERKKRISFLIKLFIYSLLVFILSRFHNEIARIGIPDSVTRSILFYTSAHIIISFSRLIIVFLYLRKYRLNKDVKNNFVLGIGRIAEITTVIIIIISILLTFNVEPIQFITSLSIVAAAIAIISKDYISNMINGMILMFSDELSLGDYVKIGSNKGNIMDITLTNVHLVNEDEDLVYIPNNNVVASETVNYTKRSVKKISFDFDAKNEMLNDLTGLENYLIEALSEYKNLIKEDSYRLKIVKINENFTSLKFQFVLNNTVSASIEKAVRKNTMRSVLYYHHLCKDIALKKTDKTS